MNYKNALIALTLTVAIWVVGMIVIFFLGANDGLASFYSYACGGLGGFWIVERLVTR